MEESAAEEVGICQGLSVCTVALCIICKARHTRFASWISVVDLPPINVACLPFFYHMHFTNV